MVFVLFVLFVMGWLRQIICERAVFAWIEADFFTAKKPLLSLCK